MESDSHSRPSIAIRYTALVALEYLASIFYITSISISFFS